MIPIIGLIVAFCAMTVVAACYAIRNDRQTKLIDRRAREKNQLKANLTAREADMARLLREQNNTREVVKRLDASKRALTERRDQLVTQLREEQRNNRIVGERIGEFHAVMNDGGVRAFFRMLKAAGMDPAQVLRNFEAEDGAFSANREEKKVLGNLPYPLDMFRMVERRILGGG